MNYLILTEKPSAAKKFATALGGSKGSYNGHTYQIQALTGHMVEFVEPHEMVSDFETENFKSWRPEFMPWDFHKMNWKKKPQKVKNLKTGKTISKGDALKQIKGLLSGIDAVVIATDKDPSGEGQLIGWEVIQAINWKGHVKRMYFADETVKNIQNSFKNMVDLPDMLQDGEFLKADVRSRWDFCSMQLVRLGTDAARNQGYNVVVRGGRLKSVIVSLVAKQLALVKAYVKKPYYEVKYTDDQGNKYTRAFDPDRDSFRFDNQTDAQNDMSKYSASAVVMDSTDRKETTPGKLLDLGGLAAILGPKGFKAKEVLLTYQKLYEAEYVSYPRTEDKFITEDQFNEMLPLIDSIASVISVDSKRLTHRKPRKTHIKDGGAHGANRPGLKVPKSLSDLQSFGPSAMAIYQTLAKNFLAMFGENYVYDSIKGHIEAHPEFITTINVPISLGFKSIFDTDFESKIDDDENDVKSVGLGKTAKPIVDSGANKKPTAPTQKWLEAQLCKYDVGTGATRTSTLAEVTAGKTALLTESKGKLGLTQIGEIAAVLLEGSMIGDPAVTEKLFKAMKNVGDLKLAPNDVLKTITDVVEHDKKVFYKNAQLLHQRVGAPKESNMIKEKTEGVFKPTGQTVRFNVEWSQHRFTDDEIVALLNGDTITIDAISSGGKAYSVEGKLGEGMFEGKPFWGFMPMFKKADDYTIMTAPFPTSWSGYTFNKNDEDRLRAGEKIKIKAISKAGKPYDVEVTFGTDTYKGVKSWKIIPHFQKKTSNAESQTRATANFKTEFSGYQLTDQEIKDVRAGGKIMVNPTSAKTGKPYTCMLSLELKEFKGNKFWGLEPHFD